MSILYKPTVKRPASGEEKYYATATNREKITISKIANLIASRSSLTRGDVMAVLYALLDVVPEHLLEGKTVSLADFGAFSVHIRSNGVDSPEKVTSRIINDVKVSFRPSPEFKKKMSLAKFEKVK